MAEDKMIVLRKTNGIITTNMRNHIENKNFDFFSNLINQKDKLIPTAKGRELTNIRRQIKRLINIVSNRNSLAIDAAISLLKRITTIDDFDKVVAIVIKAYKEISDTDFNNHLKGKQKCWNKTNDDRTVSTILEMYKNYKDIAIASFTISLLKFKFFKKIDSLSKNDYNKIYDYVFVDEKTDLAFELLDESFDEISRENGIYTLAKSIIAETVNEVYDIHQTHQCWDGCANAFPDCCPKIASNCEIKIDKFPFITDGYQVIDKNGKIESFIVSNCKLYKKVVKKKTTKEKTIQTANQKVLR